MSEPLQASVDRVLSGTHDETDLREIATAIQASQIVLATGERAIAIGGDANDSVNVSGDHNHVIVINGVEAEEIARLLQLPLAAQAVPVDELIQKVRSRASTKTLSLFSKIRLLNKRQIEVERLYVDVYVLEKQDFRATIPGLLEGRDAREQFDRFGLGKRGERSPGLAIAASEDYPRLMVLGKPGSGKSTFLRYLAVGCAKGEFLGDYIPVLLELRDVDEAAFSLLQWIHEEFELEQEAQTEQILKRGQVLILLDGLDEVPSSLQQKVQRELRKFAKRYDKNRFILTCRTQTTEYIPEQFQAVEVADFNPEQVESFALNWFTAMAETPEQGVENQKRFIERLRKTPQAAELAITPVLLSLTCWIFDDLKCLPEKRSDLYRDGLDLLLQQWDEGRGISRDSGCDRYQQLTTEERKRLLSYLAFRKFEKAENFVLFEEPELWGYIAEYLQISVEESRAVLRAIAQQHGLLIERACGIWSFSHLTFQEYLVARWICEQENWRNLTTDYLKTAWQEVFKLLLLMVYPADELVIAMKQLIDNLIKHDHDSQSFLKWIEDKQCTLESNYDPFDIKFFYVRYFSGFHLFQPLRNFDVENVEHGVYFESKIHISRDLTDIYSAKELAFDLARGMVVILVIREDHLTCISPPSQLYHSFYMAVIPQESLRLNQEVNELEPELPGSLIDNLIEKYLETNTIADEDQEADIVSDLEEEIFEQWWKINGKNWSNNFNAVVLKYCRLHNKQELRNWQNSQFNQYYNANLFLISCLYDSQDISSEVKRNIVETMFLPITEIEKRKNQSSN